MRHAATFALLSRKDVIIVASVSCIYGIGSRSIYESMTCEVDVGTAVDRDSVLRRLVELQYERNDIDFHCGTFRVRGDTVGVFPAYEADTAIRIEWFGDTVEGMSEIDPLRGGVKRKLDRTVIFPASHYATPAETLRKPGETIRAEFRTRVRARTAPGRRPGGASSGPWKVPGGPSSAAWKVPGGTSSAAWKVPGGTSSAPWKVPDGTLSKPIFPQIMISLL